jgi:hypothetical protein
MSKFVLALGIALAYHGSAGARDVRVREVCTRDRCVQYSGSDRLSSVSRDDTGRLVVRSWPDRRVIAKITEEGDGRYRVEKARRGR